MGKRLISTGSEFEKTAGYSRAIVQGDWCFVSGTTGYDYQSMEMPTDVVDQTWNCLQTIEAVLAEAGFSVKDVVRVNYYVIDKNDVPKIFPVVGGFFAEARPAATMIICELIQPEMKIEIEVTALKG